MCVSEAMATQASLEAVVLHVEESPRGAPAPSIPSPTTPEATPPREPSRPVKLVKSLSRHDLDPDLTIRPFPELPHTSPKPNPKLPDASSKPNPKSPGSDAASVRYDSEEGKLKPCDRSMIAPAARAGTSPCIRGA